MIRVDLGQIYNPAQTKEEVQVKIKEYEKTLLEHLAKKEPTGDSVMADQREDLLKSDVQWSSGLTAEKQKELEAELEKRARSMLDTSAKEMVKKVSPKQSVLNHLQLASTALNAAYKAGVEANAMVVDVPVFQEIQAEAKKINGMLLAVSKLNGL